MRRLIGTAGIVAGAAVTALLATHGPARAQALQPVSVIVFPGGFNWPIWVAQEKGYFADRGIEVKLTNTPNSVFQLTGLIEGRFDIGMTAIDNVVAYMEGQGEAQVTTPPDLFVFMGADNGLLSLVVAPEIKGFADLKGKTLSVDAMTTGYAFVLFDLLERGGLKKDDYEVVRAGGVLARWEALRERKHASTMLLTPFDILAKNAGFNVLQPAIEVYKNYQGLVGAARREWARDNRAKLEAYIRGYIAALDWLGAPANKADAIAILRKQLPQMSPELAEESYAALAPPKGFFPKARIDMEGVKRVLELRSRYGAPQKTLTDAAKYYDGTYYEAVMK
jgi:ABC-type nitrate/sulfonate/bicarbonate transport system substrate-binding protein